MLVFVGGFRSGKEKTTTTLLRLPTVSSASKVEHVREYRSQSVVIILVSISISPAWLLGVRLLIENITKPAQHSAYLSAISGLQVFEG